MRIVQVVVIALFMAVAPALAGDWPQFRGADRDGRAAETELLEAWPEGGPKLLWQSSGLGSGYSSLAVAGDGIFTMGDVDGKQQVIAVSRKDGSPLWKTAIGPAWEDRYLGSRATPTVNAGYVYALGTEGDLVCLKASDGSQIWKRNLVKDFGGVMMEIQGTDWKFSESPLVHGDRVIVTPGSSTAALVALDKSTGKELWRTAISDLGEKGGDGAGYSSVVVSNAAGVEQYVQLLGRGVIGVEVATGKLLWSYNRVANEIANIATPLVFGDHVFVSTGYGTGSALLKIESGEGGLTAKELYFLDADTMQNHHGGLVRDGDQIYTGTGHNKGFPLALHWKSGEVAWGPIRNEGKSSAAIAFADGHLYFRYQDGLMVLIQATPEGYVERGSFQIPDVKRESWSHPVIADGLLYLKEQQKLYVYDLRAGASK